MARAAMPTPAGQPLVLFCSAVSCSGAGCTPALSRSAAVSPREKRNWSARNSRSVPVGLSRETADKGYRLDRTSTRPAGRWRTRTSRPCRACPPTSSCASSRTSRTGRSSSSSASMSSARYSGGAVGHRQGRARRLSADTAGLAATAAATVDHSRRGSLSSRSRSTQAVTTSGEVRTHSASNMVLPNPAGAHTATTSEASSRSVNSCLRTTNSSGTVGGAILARGTGGTTRPCRAENSAPRLPRVRTRRRAAGRISRPIARSPRPPCVAILGAPRRKRTGSPGSGATRPPLWRQAPVRRIGQF